MTNLIFMSGFVNQKAEKRTPVIEYHKQLYAVPILNIRSMGLDW